MNCPNCQTSNPDGARFCFNCGAAFPLTCSNCGANLQPGARFCHNCGQPVSTSEKPAPAPVADQAALPHVERPSQPQLSGDQLQRYIPKELLSKLEAARSSHLMEGERRVVTIMFCDLAGSTQAASHLDPEEWAGIINGAFGYMIQPVYNYEGTVARLQGDGLLAFFGAPIAHEDDPQRAVLAGLEVVQGVRDYGRQIKETWSIDFDVRVGINTGLVVVGAVGSDMRVEYSALGDAINLAARMEQSALPGTVQIAEATYKLIAPLFEFEVVKDLAVKGRAAPVTAYRVLRQRAEPGSLRGIAGLHAPLIGRKSEMDALWAALTALDRGSGHVVSVSGEAGLGKSRLISEFKQAALADPSLNVQWLEGRALSFETKTPFAPFINLFGRYFELSSGDPDRDRYEQILERLEPLFLGRSAEIAPFFATLLGIHLQSEAAERVRYLEPPHLRSLIFSHVAAFVEALVASQRVVIFVDDLHWADSTSLELLNSLLPITDRAPLMILAAYRPRRHEPSWGFHEHAEREYYHRYKFIDLIPLDNAQSRQLVGSLLHIEDLPEKVRHKILEKSEGNPFFVEELIRSLLDTGLVVRVNGHWRATQEINNIQVPDTLSGVITARLDRLEDSTKNILQAAAVVGREFSPDVLADLIETSQLLEPALVELQRRGLVLEKSRNSHRTYSFKHVLTQEAAYSSILLSNRRELHRRIADALISRLPEEAADISRHLLEARQAARAVPYLVQAGHRAARAYATEEAIGYYRQAIDLRATVENPGLLRQAYEGLGAALSFANRIPEALEVFQEMLALAESSGDVPMQISALNKLAGVTALRLGQFPQAEGLLAQAEALSRTHGEESFIPESALIRCQMCTAQADFSGVVEVMDEVVRIGEDLGSKEHIATGLEHVASSLVYLTEFEEAQKKAQEGLTVARDIGDREHEAWLLAMPLPICYLRNGDFAAAREALEEGLQIAQKIGALAPQAVAAYLLAEVARWQGEYEKALHFGQLSFEAALPLEPFMPFMLVPTLGSLGMIYLEISERFTDKIAEFHRHALRLLESPAGRASGGAAWADLGHCAIALGDLKVAEEALQQGLNYPNMFMRLERPRHLSGAALLALVRGQLDEALRLADEGRAYAEERGMRHLYPLTGLIKGRVLVARGEFQAAFAMLEQAEAEASELNMRPLVWQTQAAAAEALARLGRMEEADAKRTAAKEMVAEIADLFSDGELRQAFLVNALEKIK